MTLIEELTRFLKSKFQGVTVTYGFMPQEPSRCIVVFGTDIRPSGDRFGSRLQIQIRGEDRRSEQPAADAEAVLVALDGFSGQFVPGGRYIVRCTIDSGAAQLGTDQNNRQLYSVNVRVVHCE